MVRAPRCCSNARPLTGRRRPATISAFPFNRCTLGSEQGLIDDPVLGQGRDPYAPLQDAIMDEGEIVVPVDSRYIGLWLTGLFGDPVSNTVAAAGYIDFAVNPSDRDTITWAARSGRSSPEHPPAMRRRSRRRRPRPSIGSSPT